MRARRPDLRVVVMLERSRAMRDGGDFADQTERFRRELLAHCYRLLGSVDDAEDMVQETYLRAWRSYGGFEGRSSVRTWLYQIATNTCLTAMQHRARRPLPSGLAHPGNEPSTSTRAELTWLQPIPDALVTPESGDPAVVAVSRESLRLALIASLQHLPSRQRAVLILRDVLAFPATEVAGMLGTTTAAVKSALQRARARLDEVAPAPERVSELDDPAARALLDRYIAAFENSDADALQRLLRVDATLELPPSPVWFAGKDAATHAVAGLGSRGDWRMVATGANGQPAAAAYRRGANGAYHAYGIVVLTAASTAIPAITAITVFAEPGLLTSFGLPPVYPAAVPSARPICSPRPRLPANTTG